MSSIPPVCILAGGLGTRLGDLTRTLPKALVEIDGEPFLAHQIRGLARQGVTSVVLCVGYFGTLVEERIGDHQDGIQIAYSYDSPGLDGTLGALRRAAHLVDERFLVLYGDTLLVVDYRDLVQRWSAIGTSAIMTVLENRGRWDRSNVVCEADLVTVYDKTEPTAEMAWIDYGLSGLTRDLLDRCPEASDLADLFSLLAAERRLGAYRVDERFYEIGTPAGLEETRRYLAQSRPAGPDDAMADQ